MVVSEDGSAGPLAASKMYKQVLDVDPRHVAALTGMGAVEVFKGRFSEAVEYYNKALSIDPNDAVGYAGLGSALYGAGKLREAEVAERKAISLEPGLASAYHNLGTCLLHGGNLNAPDRYPSCSSYCIASVFMPDLAVGHPYRAVCESCGWSDHPRQKARKRKSAKAPRRQTTRVASKS